MRRALRKNKAIFCNEQPYILKFMEIPIVGQSFTSSSMRFHEDYSAEEHIICVVTN
jgi:hypothetical protein